MAVANEAPCSRLGHGVWSTPRTCSFSSCHSVPWRTVFIQWVQLRTDQKPFQQFLRTGFITAVSFFLCWKRPKPKTGISRSLDGKGWETKWLIDNTRSVKCVFECQVQGPSYWWRWPTLLSGRATRGPLRRGDVGWYSQEPQQKLHGIWTHFSFLQKVKMGLVWALPSSAYSQPCFYMILYDTQVKSLTIIYWHLNDPVPGDWCTSKPQSLSTRTLSPFRKDRIMQCGCSKLQCPNSRPTLGSKSQKPCSTYFYRKMHMVWCCSNIRGVVERYWIYISIWKSKDCWSML